MPHAFFPLLVLAGPATMGPTPLPHTPDCSSITRITVLCAKRSGCPSLSLSFAKPVVPLAAVRARAASARVNTCVCVRFYLFIRCTRYLLSAHCVPGTVAEFLQVCLLMPLLLLWGPLSVFFVPKLLPLCQSGCLRFCASLCAFLSVLVCLQGPVCVSFPSVFDSAPLPAGHSGSLKAPGPTSLPDLPCPYSAGRFPQSHF